MFSLYVLRHADAEPMASSDAARALTEKGRAQSVKVGKFLAAHGLKPALILHSPFKRTQQTAELVAKELGMESAAEVTLRSGMRPEEGIAMLKTVLKRDEPLLIVGHEPDLGELMGILIGTAEQPARLEVKKASLWLLEMSSVRAAGGYLAAAVPVKLMGE